MFAVVEQEEYLLGSKTIHNARLDEVGRGFTNSECECNRLGDEGRIDQRSQIHQPDSVREVVELPRRGFKTESGLAAAAGASERHQARICQQVLNPAQFFVSADEARDLRGEIVLLRLCD